MKLLLSFITFVAWALWFGGTIAVFVFGWHFQKSLPPAIFHETARELFHSFSKYQLSLAAVSLVTSGLLLVIYPSKASVLIVACLVLAGGMTVTFSLGLMPAMDVLLDEGKRDSTQFRTMHGKSMIALAMQALELLGTGWIILMSQRTAGLEVTTLAKPETSAETARV